MVEKASQLLSKEVDRRAEVEGGYRVVDRDQAGRKDKEGVRKLPTKEVVEKQEDGSLLAMLPVRTYEQEVSFGAVCIKCKKTSHHRAECLELHGCWPSHPGIKPNGLVGISVQAEPAGAGDMLRRRKEVSMGAGRGAQRDLADLGYKRKGEKHAPGWSGRSVLGTWEGSKEGKMHVIIDCKGAGGEEKEESSFEAYRLNSELR